MSLQDQFTMPLNEAVYTQRAIRKVKTDKIDDDILIQLVEFATKAPTAQNKQDYEFIIITDPEVIAEIGAENWKMWRFISKSMDRKAEKEPSYLKTHLATKHAAENFNDYPALIIACYRGSRYFTFPPILGTTTYASILPSVQNLLLAARSIGLGANLTTMPLWSNRKARKILGLPYSITPAVAVTLGWPQGRYGPTTRRPVGDVISLNTFGNRPWAGKTADQISETTAEKAVQQAQGIAETQS